MILAYVRVSVHMREADTYAHCIYCAVYNVRIFQTSKIYNIHVVHIYNLSAALLRSRICSCALIPEPQLGRSIRVLRLRKWLIIVYKRRQLTADHMIDFKKDSIPDSRTPSRRVVERKKIGCYTAHTYRCG